MALNGVWYCLRQTITSLTRNLWLNIATTAMIAVALVILGGFLLLAANANHFMHLIESTVEINVFLEEEADTREVNLELTALRGVEEVRFISKEEGLREMEDSFGERGDLLQGLAGEKNPLPDSFRVQAEEADLVPPLAEKIGYLPGVETVSYGQEYVETLLQVTQWMNVIALLAVLILAAAAMFLIITTIRLSLLARQEEVSIMKYLGASNWFIRGPFLLEGMVIGFIGSCLAVLALSLGYYYLVVVLERLPVLFFVQPVVDVQMLGALLGGLLLIGIFMGGIGSVVSIRKFLKV